MNYIHTGCVDVILKNGSIIKYSRVTITTIDKMFNPRPALAICGMLSWPFASTFALVPDSSIKVQDAEIVAGTINK
jgi:hypothetical protein